jgi:predicted Zn finger-like uncharacterized protein
MDIRCERCGTSYALDESRLGEAGARVRCARCGHVFLVTRSGEPPPAAAATVARPAEPVRREWRVRLRDGSVSRLRELTTLQRWIVEGKLRREDEIGLDGENWKRMGSIPDLEAFFAVVDAAARAKALEAELVRLQSPSIPAESGASVSDLASAVSAAIASEFPEPAPLPEEHKAPAAASPPVAATRRTGLSAPPASGLPEPAFTRSVAKGFAVTTTDEWEPPRLRRSASAWVVLLLALLALGGGGTVLYYRVWLPEAARAREEQARNAQLEQEQQEREQRLRTAEERAKQELLQALAASASTQDAGTQQPSADAGVPRGALDTPPSPSPTGAPPGESTTPARAVALAPGGAAPAAAPAGEGTPAAAPAVVTERRGPPQTFEEWMAEGHRRRTHERAAAALAAYDRALALKPGRAEAHTGRALALLDLGRRTEALAEFQRALELDPRDGIAVLGMAETYRSLGRTEEARRAYQRYLDGWPGGSEGRAARAALESLKE